MSLEDTKSRLSTKYLGKAGIHGIGLSRARNAVRVHVSAEAPASTEGPSGSAGSRASLLDDLKHDAAPYEVLISVEHAPVKLA
ncbi:hypothetical protein OPKNFCMD_5083 [Methylobacterium crusticola]|uniref:Uncharacterized protein n=1 Tax=Methylobacterium crusticola TaxID=1697972 RepID=A0ABQ4R3Q7_9HYPH|nr:hypothetical protein [Methylobacterium crusticola]GJD52320.1 hypothetical protein OPKNFCMD_5083 [Methylobacterium crusticola]